MTTLISWALTWSRRLRHSQVGRHLWAEWPCSVVSRACTAVPSPLLKPTQQRHPQGAQQDRGGGPTQQALGPLTDHEPLAASTAGNGLQPSLQVDCEDCEDCTCMPSLPEMPTPTWAAWIMGTSLAPSPMASVTPPTPCRTSLSSGSQVSHAVSDETRWMASRGYGPCVGRQPSAAVLTCASPAALHMQRWAALRHE